MSSDSKQGNGSIAVAVLGVLLGIGTNDDDESPGAFLKRVP
jgi:hypothetical protein